MTKLCPTCHIPTDSIKAVIAKNAVLTGCNSCLSTLTHGHELAASHHRKQDQRQYAADLVQPIEPEKFAKLYPKQAVEEYGYTEEMMRKYG